MTQEEIIEGNKLIAEFMEHKWVIEECEYCGKNVNRIPLCDGDKEGNKRTHALGGLLIDLKYHSSWGWLMPVVEKISKETRFELIFTANKFICATPNIPDGLDKTTDNNHLNIKALWMACMEYIKWHNTKTP